jgi:hypothetical protein
MDDFNLLVGREPVDRIDDFVKRQFPNHLLPFIEFTGGILASSPSCHSKVYRSLRNRQSHCPAQPNRSPWPPRMIRHLVERMSRNRAFRRWLPQSFGGRPVYLSGDSALSYLKPD